MRNKLHDGPSEAFLIRSGQIRRPVSKPRASIAALQWAAEQANMTYGQFTQRLAPEDEVRIQLEYDEMRRQRAAEAAERRAQRELADQADQAEQARPAGEGPDAEEDASL